MSDIPVSEVEKILKADEAFKEWWVDVGREHFEDDEQSRQIARTTFIDAYVMGYNER